jgi:EAL domain-containing protein (putative c-di-GMP-specific phosphodiesterase class I)
VCDQLRAWQYADATGSFLKVSINLSLLVFRDPAMVDRICEIVTKAGIPPKIIEFEITETGLMMNYENTRAQLQDLKKFGFQLSIDDFGTGYSSLHRLAQMPIDALKIAMEFVRGLDKEFANAVMVRTIIQLGHSLELQVVAEGVEEERHLAYLRELECDLLQGYLFDRPLDAEAFHAKWLKTEVKTDTPSNVVRVNF